MPTLAFERKGFISVSYYDQLLEFIGYDLFGVRTRLAVSSHLSPQSYSQKEYFDDLFSAIFQSAVQQKALAGRKGFAARLPHLLARRG